MLYISVMKTTGKKMIVLIVLLLAFGGGILLFARSAYRAQGQTYQIKGTVRAVADGSSSGTVWGIEESGIFAKRLRVQGLPESLQRENTRVACTYIFSGLTDDFTGWEAVGTVARSSDCETLP